MSFDFGTLMARKTGALGKVRKGEVLKWKVTRVVDFGAFANAEITYKDEQVVISGLVQSSNLRLRGVVLYEGDYFNGSVSDFDPKGNVSISFSSFPEEDYAEANISDTNTNIETNEKVVSITDNEPFKSTIQIKNEDSIQSLNEQTTETTNENKDIDYDEEIIRMEIEKRVRAEMNEKAKQELVEQISKITTHASQDGERIIDSLLENHSVIEISQALLRTATEFNPFTAFTKEIENDLRGSL